MEFTTKEMEMTEVRRSQVRYGTLGFNSSSDDPHGWEDSFDLEADDSVDDENFCTLCDSPVRYAGPSDSHGTCNCETH